MVHANVVGVGVEGLGRMDLCEVLIFHEDTTLRKRTWGRERAGSVGLDGRRGIHADRFLFKDAHPVID